MGKPDIAERVSRVDERLRAHTHLLGGLRLNQEDGFDEVSRRLAQVEEKLVQIADLLTADRLEPDKV
jgi:Ni,Fe-hydrogenase III large subunit